MRSRPVVVLVAVLGLLVVAGGAAVIGRDSGDRARYVSEHPVTAPAQPRTVMVSQTMPAPSAHARRLSAMLESGAMPHEPMMAEVLTDTDCTPDAEMVSRCRNEMALAGGGMIVVRHPHDMRHVPCLAPGEEVRLVPASA